MKLLYISNQRLPTEKAYGIQITKMCEAFAEEGLDVRLLIPSRQNPIVETPFEYYGLKENFKIERTKTFDFDWPGNMTKISFHIKMFLSAAILSFWALFSGADIIYSRDEWPILMVSLLRGHLYFEAHKISKSRRWMYKLFIFRNIKIITTTSAMKDEFILLGLKPSNVIVEHDGVDLSRFNISDDKNALRRKLNLSEDKIIIGYVGHLTTMGVEKGIDDLFGAIKILQKDNSHIQLVIVGGAEGDIEDYKKRSSDIDIEIIFTGQKSHKLVPQYLKAFDVLAMPFPRNRHYAYYMSPLKMFEYMASERPIVATRLPSVSEVLNNDNAVLVEPNSPEDLAEGIIKVINDVNFGDKIAEQAHKDVQNFTWQKRAQRIINFINKSANRA